LKTCSDCGETLPLSEYYSVNQTTKEGEKYKWYMRCCKECNKNRTRKWRKENTDGYKKQYTKLNNTEKQKEKLKKSNRERRESGKYREWQQSFEGKQYLNVYNGYRRQNKTHLITDEEWRKCKKYFNNRCAYCGVTEDKAIETQGNRLHKEHAIHNGANDISNCIPSCKRCNSRKWANDYTDWYTEENPVFNQNRLTKIKNWLERDFEKHQIN